MWRIFIFLLIWSVIVKPKPIESVEMVVKGMGQTIQAGRMGMYDYSPTVMEENGVKRMYVCGGGSGSLAGHDAIYYTEIVNGQKSVDSRLVLKPLVGMGDDGVHACAPSVIKHSFGALENGKEKYLLYYECAPKVYGNGGKEMEMFTQICVAFSDDGVNFKKYNEDIWASQWRMANENEPPTAVIKLNQKMANKFGIEKRDGKYFTNLDSYDLNAYGVGHPSALVRDGKIWVYYYDSVGEWGERGVFLRKSDDGFHFGEAIRIEDVKSQGEMRWLEKTRKFVYFGSAFEVGFYNYSDDGVNWQWSEEDRVDFYKDFLKKNYSFSATTDNTVCFAPGGLSMTADKWGNVIGNEAELWIGYGKLGALDGCSSATCSCYSVEEDRSRGSTWDVYGYKMNISIKGDYDEDGKVGMLDFEVWKADFLAKRRTMIEFEVWKSAFLTR